MNKNVDTFFTDGCGRCERYQTPQCSVVLWQPALLELRRIIRSCGLQEVSKWGHPVYTVQQANVVMLAAFKDNCTLSFFKGALLQDADGILTKPGDNTHGARILRVTNANDVLRLEDTIRAYVFEAMEIEKAGLKVDYEAKKAMDYPEELEAKFDAFPAFREAFEGLTPGRQRGYLIFFTGAKQSATRTSRIEKHMERILQGKGMQDP